jgi:response regulator of citrate/malate metabolism
VASLARQFNIHRSTVGRHLQTRGVNTRTPGLQADEVAAAVDLYQAGWSLMKIAAKLKASATTIRRYLTIAGVVLRGPHERVR